MRSLILSLILGAVALGAVALTPGQADANWWGRRGYYGSYYPGGYYSSYYPSYSYYAPGYSSFYTPAYRPYMPAYTYYSSPVIYTSPGTVYYRGW
jgi:hypothetical protein